MCPGLPVCRPWHCAVGSAPGDPLWCPCIPREVWMEPSSLPTYHCLRASQRDAKGSQLRQEDRRGWKGPTRGRGSQVQNWDKHSKRLMLCVVRGGEHFPTTPEQGRTAVVCCKSCLLPVQGSFACLPRAQDKEVFYCQVKHLCKDSPAQEKLVAGIKGLNPQEGQSQQCFLCTAPCWLALGKGSLKRGEVLAEVTWELPGIAQCVTRGAQSAPSTHAAHTASKIRDFSEGTVLPSLTVRIQSQPWNRMGLFWAGKHRWPEPFLFSLSARKKEKALEDSCRLSWD